MSGLGGLNPPADGMVVGLVQLQLPTVQTPADLERTLGEVLGATRAAKRANPALDLVLFPEHSLHTGLVIDDAGAVQIRSRKLHPWVPVEPWAPGDLGTPVYTYMHDLVAGEYRLPWEERVQVTDGTSRGFAPPPQTQLVR